MFWGLQLIAVLLAVTTLFAWINSSFVGLPENIGLLVMGFRGRSVCSEMKRALATLPLGVNGDVTFRMNSF